ncbi:MAG: phage holin family protein [Proteobacteria bacterium]|nr:phage holin family protein [Pseudomonadota bacterium]
MLSHTWRFFRTGGFDQVSIETGADLLSLQDLDQKLWAALSCPVKDLEFDLKTLEFVDSDHDGHIRAPEIIEAVTWAGSVLKDPEFLVKGSEGVPLSVINNETDEGRGLLSSARQILKNLGKGNTDVINIEDTNSEERIFAQMKFNGDGIITVESADDDAVRSVITDIINSLDADTDRSGNPGISQDKVDQFFNEIQAYSEWQKNSESDPSILILSDATENAFEALTAIKDKVNDYFTRCLLAKFDKRSAESLNPSDADYLRVAPQDLSVSSESFASFPVAIVEPDRHLPLTEGINPAWIELITRFRENVVEPVFGDKNSITAEEWDDINIRFTPYRDWHSAKPETSVEKLGIERINEIINGSYKQLVDELIARDKAFEPEANAISSVDKLVRYCRYLHTLINNFVAFRDFYDHRSKAVFQSGTLYLDGRSCDLCVKVDDIATHVVLSSLSRLYLVYCNCIRRGGTDKMIIAAAFTAGDSDQLIVGRNGVFYDRKGQDWDATIARIIEHPISIRQAFWSPYKQAGKMISEQLMKLAAARSKASEDRMAVSAMQSGMQTASGKPPAEKAFDAGRFAGIFAAIGLAIGAIGTAIASIVTGLLRLPWWQLPLVAIGVMLLISGPSMLIAWLKLKKRNLGPILDASGWAVNARAKINIKFGTSLTDVARLPEGAKKSLADPYADKKKPWGLYILIILLIISCIVFWKYGYLAMLLKLY